MCSSIGLKPHNSHWVLNPQAGTQTQPKLRLGLEPTVFYLFTFLAALSLHCCARAFSSCGERGLLFVVVHGLLIVVASLVAEHGL